MKFKISKQLIVNKIYWLGILGIASTQALSMNPCLAQSSNIVTDDSLGNETSQIENNSQLRGLPVELIRGGAQRGINLFHSFREFNVSEGRGAYFFSSNAEIQNILTRVTGSNRSEILGTLGTFGNSQPNLFLINPNGILFGENASLDLQGSFVGTTANGVQFGERGVFSATNPEAPALLSVNPSALFFNQIQSGTIENRSTAALGNDVFGLKVPDGRSLLLLGGDIVVDGGILNAPGGDMELAGIQSSGEVGLNFDSNNNPNLNIPNNLARTDVTIKNSSTLNVVANNGGNIDINARNIEIAGSQLFAGINPGLGNNEKQAGDITLNAQGSTVIKGTITPETITRSRIRNFVYASASGKGGDIKINTESLSVRDFSSLETTTRGLGDAGKVLVQAKNEISLREGSTIFNTVSPGGVGNAGGVTIQANSFSLLEGAEIQAGNRGGMGNGGNVNVDVRDCIIFDGLDNDGFSSGIFTGTSVDGIGSSGNVKVRANHLKLSDGARIQTKSSGEGDIGDIDINVDDSIILDGTRINPNLEFEHLTGIFTNSKTKNSSVGNAGNLTIKTNTFLVKNGAYITTSTSSRGKGGNLTVNAQDIRLIGESKDGLSGSGFFTSAQRNSTGDAGNLTISTNTLLVKDGAEVSTKTFGKGKGGDLTVNAQDVKLIGESENFGFSSGLFASVQPNSTGNAGNLTISTNTLLIQDGAEASTITFGEGKGGDLKVNAKEIQLIRDKGSSTGLFASADLNSKGDAGNLTIKINKLFVQGGAQVLTTTFGEGKGGNLNVNAQDIQIIGRTKDAKFPSGLFASAGQSSKGDAGNLTLFTNKLLIQDGAQVGAGTFGEGKGGNLNVNAQDVQLIGTSKNGSIGSFLFTSAQQNSTGDAGNLKIITNKLQVLDGASISTDTVGSGNGGDLIINARDIEIIGQSEDYPFESLSFDNLDVQIIDLSDNSQLDSTSTENMVNLARFTITSNISANTFYEGKGGNLTINADTLKLEDNGILATQSTGKGVSGNININLKDNFNANKGQIITQAQQSSGGNIKITAGKNIFLRNNSDIKTILSTTDNTGGDIQLNAKTIVALEDSDILAFAPEGKGGNISFNTRAFLSKPLYNPTTPQTVDKETLDALDSNNLTDINASGSISTGDIIGIPDISFLQDNLTDLPANQIDTNALIASSCIARSNQREENSFTITGSGGLRNNPVNGFVSQFSTGDVRNVEQVSRAWKKGDAIVEPTGAYKLADGRLILGRICK